MQPPWPRAPSESTQAPFPGLVSEDKVRVPLFLNRERAKGPVWPQDGSPSCGNMELHFPVDGIPVELIQILKDDVMKVLHSICQQIWKAQQRPQNWKRSVFIPIPKKGIAKECSNYRTIALISHASKIMLKILQVRFQQYVNQTSRCLSWI